MNQDHVKIVTENRKARHEFFILDEFEAGMVLQGTEVKSLRQGRANLKDSYGKFKNGELWLHQMHIGPYPFAYYDNHEPERPRKLLMHKSELKRLYGKIKEKGHTLVPLRVYFRDGKAKVVMALAKGKRQYDKRDSIKEREVKREMDRAKKHAR
ncbi:MAG: SsrA-binding protein SmpB [Desulfobacteraceae bacterium]|uniref:SsrA-binding protein SmpB n=1 Tax=Desulfosalsimonas sp. TaxID=3073848 RepID=UPI003970A874|nr:SsrA-binding protein SmpB [Desulfobacteraceae bacterium]